MPKESTHRECDDTEQRNSLAESNLQPVHERTDQLYNLLDQTRPRMKNSVERIGNCNDSHYPHGKNASPPHLGPISRMWKVASQIASRFFRSLSTRKTGGHRPG